MSRVWERSGRDDVMGTTCVDGHTGKQIRKREIRGQTLQGLKDESHQGLEEIHLLFAWPWDFQTSFRAYQSLLGWF